jgi:hypothetical protein
MDDVISIRQENGSLVCFSKDHFVLLTNGTWKRIRDFDPFYEELYRFCDFIKR